MDTSANNSFDIHNHQHHQQPEQHHQQHDNISSTSPATVPATTISTIVLQSQPIQIVVGLLQSKNELHVKIVEITPKLTFLGADIDETVQLQREHEKIHKKLQEQHTPIEEFAVKAQRLIDEENASPELLNIMGQSLETIWEDLLRVFQQRREVLDINANFHEKIGICIGKIASLEEACRDTMLPKEIETIQEFLSKFKQLRIEVLASVMASLKEGNELLAKLKETALCGNLESRPDSIKVEIKKSVSQVELWLEELHDRRNSLEHSWQTRKLQLEQCLALAILTKDLNELNQVLQNNKRSLENSNLMLDSEINTTNALIELEGFKQDAIALRDRALKITRSTEKLTHLGCFAGDDVSGKAYIFLNDCTEFLEYIDNREQFLVNVKEFFAKAERALSVLKKIESEVTAKTKDTTQTKQALIALHSRTLHDINILTEEPLRLGYALLDMIGRSNSEAAGIEYTIVEIENIKIYLEELCTANSEQYVKMTEALNTFYENYNNVSAWLVSVNKAFLRTNNLLGATLEQSKSFLQLHHQLLSDLEIKGTEINDLLITTSEILDQLDDNERTDVDNKVRSIHENWNELKTIVENRVDLSTIYVKFLQLADKLTDMFTHVEEVLKTTPEDSKLSQLDLLWNKLIPVYSQLKDEGKQFKENVRKIADAYLDTAPANARVEQILNNFSKRQINITESWEHWTTVIVEKRETELQLEEIMSRNELTLISASKLDAQLYPILTSQSNEPNSLKLYLNEKLLHVLNDIETAQDEINQHIQITAGLKPKDEKTAEKVTQVLQNLNGIVDKLSVIHEEFKSLVESIIVFLEDLISTKNIIDQYFNQIPVSSKDNIDVLLVQTDSFKNDVLSKFKKLLKQSEKLIDQIREQEPIEAKEHDIKCIIALLENLKITFEERHVHRTEYLKKEMQFYRFKEDLSELFKNIDHLRNQLNETQGQFKETAASAKSTSLGFDYFEQTIQLLDKRIEIFISSSETLCNNNSEIKPFVINSITELTKYWNDFKDQVNNTRHSIEDTKSYFNLNDQIDQWYREHKAYLETISNQIPFAKNPTEATELIHKIDTYISDNEAKQLNHLKNLATLSKTVYGFDKTVEKYSETIELFQSFFSTKTHLINLIEHLIDDLNRGKQQAEQLRTETTTKVHRTQEMLQTQQQPQFAAVSQLEPPVFLQQLSDATVQEGDKFTFKCQVVGNSLPSVEWFKDGISIKNYPDYISTYENGLCTLSIEETFTEDSACFRCQATNAAGTAETSARLFVRETEQEVILIPAHFTKLLENYTCNEGESLKLQCFVEGNPLPTVQWFKNGNCIDDLPQYEITYNNGEAILQFNKLQASDQGVYVCKAKNIIGVDQCSTTLTILTDTQAAKPSQLYDEKLVQTIQEYQRPEFKIPLSNVMARVGQTIKLDCTLTGYPQPELIWKLDGKPPSSSNAKLQLDNERVTLLISEAYPKDAGTYTLCAKNPAGVAYTSCNVSVKGRLPNDLSDSETNTMVQLEPVKPTVELPLKNVTALEGKCVQLDCVVVGQPEPEVIWYHEGRPVKESSDVQLYFRGDRCSLVIQEAYLEDMGEYKIVAINSAGETSSTCKLTVTPKNKSEPVKQRENANGIDVNISETAPPRFENLLSDILANEGETIEFQCILKGTPTPTVKWCRNNIELLESDRIKFVHNQNDGFVKLILNNVSTEDKGVYTVKALNSYGDAKCFSQLIVKSVNASDNLLIQNNQRNEIEDKSLCPTFKERFFDKITNLDESVKFECIIAGKPSPQIKWLFNDKPVQGKNFLVSTSGERQVLTIPHVNREVTGKISCTAENDVGKAVCIAYLSLVGDFNAPSSENCQRYFEEYNTESSNVTIKKQFSTSTRTSQVNTYQLENGGSEIKTAIDTQDFIVKKIPEIIESKQLSEIHETMTQQSEKIQPHSAGTVKSQSGDLLLKGAGRKTTAPRFITPFNGKILDQGSDVTLEAIIDGYPTPHIALTKNGEALKENENVKITQRNNKITIELRNVTIKDAGRYSCSITNDTGNAISTADIVVKKSVFPPVFGHRLQAQVVKRGERVVMDVEVSGIPEPAVTWYKDNKPLDEVAISQHLIKKFGNNYTMIIEKATAQDAGKYMVRAVNTGGEAQSIADFVVLEPTPERMIEVVKTVSVHEHAGEELKADDKSSTAPLPSSYHTSQTESTSQSEQHGTTEESTFTETRCVTETTMRMEHKSPHPDIQAPSPIPYKDRIPHTVSSDITYLKTEVKPIVNVNLPVTSSIQPQNKIDSLVNKSISSNTSETIKYTTFENTQRPDQLLQSDLNATNVQQDALFSKISSPLPKPYDASLIPGSPPEIGYMPKAIDVNRTSISDRIKRLESSYDETHEAPQGGIKVFPPGPGGHFESKESFSETIIRKSEKETPVLHTPAETVYPPVHSVSNRDFEVRTISPRFSIENKKPVDIWTSPKPFEPSECVKSPVFGDANHENLRKQTIKETARAIENRIKEVENSEYELKAPSLVRHITPSTESYYSPRPLSDTAINYLQPGPPPEMCFAPRPTSSPKTADSTPTPTMQRAESRKFKPIKSMETSGYVADTEESLYSCTKTQRFESSSNKQYYETHDNKQITQSEPFSFYDSKTEKTFQTSGNAEKDYAKPSVTSNISINSKHIKIKEEPQIQALPPCRYSPNIVPSPIKFRKTEFRESDYESDYETKIQPVWRPNDTGQDLLAYKPVKPNLTPTGRVSHVSSERSPIPPSEFEKPLKFDSLTRPKFEPIDKYKTTTTSEQFNKSSYEYQVLKPKPVSAKQPQIQSKPYQKPCFKQPTQYYTAVAGTPQHNLNSLATETSNQMHLQEHTESCRRVVNMSSTKRVIQFDNKQQEYYQLQQQPFQEKLELSPFKTETNVYTARQRLPPPATPTKFVPGEYRESDYDSEIESARIRSIWTPNPSDSDEPQYRRVIAPTSSRSVSATKSYEAQQRILTPMEFDTGTPEMPSKINIHRTPSSSPQYYAPQDSYRTQTLDRYLTKKKSSLKNTRDDIDITPRKHGYSPINSNYEQSSSHRVNKQYQYHGQTSSGDGRLKENIKPILKRPQSAPGSGQVYREESKVSQYGTKHIDPDTGLIYFKYDFGYEFGIIFPGEGRKFVAGGNKITNSKDHWSKFCLHNSAGVIDIPVLHEKTFNKCIAPTAPMIKSKSSSPYGYRKQSPIEIRIDEFHDDIGQRRKLIQTENQINHRMSSETPVNFANEQEHLPKRPPIFITPLKDIAVVSGQTARFECIVQCDPHPYVEWFKNDVRLCNDMKYLLEFRNGVCRLTIPNAQKSDAGIYSCTGTNHLGSVVTSAELIVPSENWGIRK